jgi:hypothetical protein
MKKKLTIIFAAMAVCLTGMAQDVVQESLEWSKLRILPSVQISTPLSKESEIVLPLGVNLEATYDLGKIASLTGGLNLGTFSGVTLGGTYYLSNKMVTGNTKFIVAETGKKIYFYKGISQYQTFFGPTAQIKLGNYSDAGFHGRIDAGIDFRIKSRAFYDGFPSGFNGFSSIKLKATALKFNQFEYGIVDGLHSRVGLGVLGSYTAELKPWEFLSIYADVEMGFYATPGVQDYVMNEYATMENPHSGFILGLKAGASINLDKL